jgi:isocitrate/isopropylmalate dehydrogenase
MDNDAAVAALTPAALKGQYRAKHRDWMQRTWDGGFQHAREKLQQYANATLIKNAAEIPTLDKDIQDALVDMAAGTKTYCMADVTF